MNFVRPATSIISRWSFFMFVKQSELLCSSVFCTMPKKIESPMVLINWTSVKFTTSFFDPWLSNCSLICSSLEAPTSLMYPLGIMTAMPSRADFDDKEKLLMVFCILLLQVRGLCQFLDEYDLCPARRFFEFNVIDEAFDQFNSPSSSRCFSPARVAEGISRLLDDEFTPGAFNRHLQTVVVGGDADEDLSFRSPPVFHRIDAGFNDGYLHLADSILAEAQAFPDLFEALRRNELGILGHRQGDVEADLMLFLRDQPFQEVFLQVRKGFSQDFS